MSPETIAAVVGSVLGGGAVSAVVSYALNRRKTSAEGRQIEVRGELQIVDTALEMAKRQEAETTRLISRVVALESSREEMRAQVVKLEGEVSALERDNRHLEGQVKRLTSENDTLRKRLDAHK